MLSGGFLRKLCPPGGPFAGVCGFTGGKVQAVGLHGYAAPTATPARPMGTGSVSPRSAHRPRRRVNVYLRLARPGAVRVPLGAD